MVKIIILNTVYSLKKKIVGWLRKYARFTCKTKPEQSLVLFKFLGLFIVKYKSLKCLPTIWLDELEIGFIKEIEPPILSEINSPKTIVGSTRKVENKIEAIRLFHLSDIIISPISAHFLYGGKVILERVLNVGDDIADYSTGFLYEHNYNHAVVYSNYEEVIDKGVLLIGNGSFNYYHWLIEILPKIFYYKKVGILSKGIPLIVNDKVKEYSSFRDSLSLALGGFEVELIYLEQSKNYKIKEAYFINTPNNLVYNLRENHGFELNYFFFRESAIKQLRDMMPKEISQDQGKPYPRKIFLGRRSKVRQYNQEEVFNFFKEKGFQKIYPEDYSFEEQTLLFKKAKFIVGAAGAAWTNIIFCEKKTKAICWMVDRVKNFSSFSTLAEFSGVDMRYFFYKVDGKDYHSPYTIDLKEKQVEIEQFIES